MHAFNFPCLIKTTNYSLLKIWLRFLITGIWRKSLSLSSGCRPPLPSLPSSTFFSSFSSFSLSLFYFFFFILPFCPDSIDKISGSPHYLASESSGLIFRVFLNFLLYQNFYFFIMKCFTAASVDLNSFFKSFFNDYDDDRTMIDIFIELLACTKP